MANESITRDLYSVISCLYSSVFCLYLSSMKPETTVQQHIDQLHELVRSLMRSGKSDADIITHLRQTGVNEFYARTIIENVEADKDGKKSLWKLYAAALLSLAAFGFIFFYPGFDPYRGGLIYWFLFWTPLIAAVTFATRAWVIFRK